MLGYTALKEYVERYTIIKVMQLNAYFVVFKIKGDFAVFIRNGMDKKMALCWNFLSSLFAFVGLYVGINLAMSEICHHWIFAVVAGFFLYISFIDLVSNGEVTSNSVYAKKKLKWSQV